MSIHCTNFLFNVSVVLEKYEIKDLEKKRETGGKRKHNLDEENNKTYWKA